MQFIELLTDDAAEDNEFATVEGSQFAGLSCMGGPARLSCNSSRIISAAGSYGNECRFVRMW